ncbi:MAG: hypothetical protein ACNA8N_07230 [Trueperaceae bacterium]
MTTEPHRFAQVPPPRGGGCGRWIVGCGVTTLVFLVVVGGAAWWFVGRPVVEAFQAIQRIESLGSLQDRVADRRPYAVPADGLLRAEQVERFVAVQGHMERELTGRIERLERLMDDFDRRRPDGLEIVLLAEAYAEMLRLLVEVLEAQASALDAEGFTAEEYAWVRREVLRAAGYGGFEEDVDGFVGALTGDAAAMVGPRPVATPVPEANRALVERYREVLDETAALALLGL